MTIYYIIWFFFSFVFGLCIFAFIYLCLVSTFLTLTQSHYQHYEFIMHYQQKLFLTLPYFFLSLVSIITQLPVNKQLNTTLIYSLSLYLSYLYNIKEREPQSQKAKKKKKKKKPQAQIQFTITNISSSLSVKTQTPQVHKHRFLDSKIHKQSNIILGFEG